MLYSTHLFSLLGAYFKLKFTSLPYLTIDINTLSCPCQSFPILLISRIQPFSTMMFFHYCIYSSRLSGISNLRIQRPVMSKTLRLTYCQICLHGIVCAASVRYDFYYLTCSSTAIILYDFHAEPTWHTQLILQVLKA